MLPIPYNTDDLWLLQIKDTNNQILSSFHNPVDIPYERDINTNKFNWENPIPNYWKERSPILNRYMGQINCLFDANDTVYQYNIQNHILTCRYILDLGMHDVKQQHQVTQDIKVLSYLQPRRMMETKDYLFFIIEQKDISYLTRFNKQTGEIQSLHNKGEIKHDPTLGYYADILFPGFTNDLSGGLTFFPDYTDDKRWIAVYQPYELLEKIDQEKLANTKVLFPEMKKKLLDILSRLKEDDNPIVLIVTLK